MDSDKILKIKNAVKKNFEQSPDKYTEFENKYGFFYKLNAHLLDRLKIHSTLRVLDVGCGTGASSRQILQTIPGVQVFGLDNSPSMLDVAKSDNPDPERLCFIEGDAARLTSIVDEPMDIIIYSASIFLIPDYEESLSQAWSLLSKGGKLGLTFMVGVYDQTGENAFLLAEERAKTGISLRKPVELEKLAEYAQGLFVTTNADRIDFTCGPEFVRDFFSIPAMSAGLYPADPYEERLEKLDRLIANTPSKNLFFRWSLITCTK